MPFAVLWLPIEMGGAGEWPEGLLFPSKDGVIMWAATHDKELYQILNVAAAIMDVKPPDLATRLGRMYFDGTKTKPLKPMERYEKYIDLFVKDETRTIASARAQKKLRRFGVSIGHSVYTNFKQNLITNTVASNAKVVRLNAEAKKKTGRDMEYNSRKEEYPDYLDEKYGWQKNIQITDGPVIERVLDACPIVGLSEGLQEIAMRIGISLDFSHFRKTATALLGFLRRDKGFPRYITEDNLFKILTKANIANFPERIALALIAIGVSERHANLAVSTFIKDKDTFKIYMNSKTLARNDHFVSMLDLTEGRLNDLIEMPLSGNRQVDLVIRELALGWMLVKAQKTGKVRKQIITYDDSARARMLTDITGYKYNKIIKYMKIYDLYTFNGKL